jgi:hypothetical protein
MLISASDIRGLLEGFQHPQATTGLADAAYDLLPRYEQISTGTHSQIVHRPRYAVDFIPRIVDPVDSLFDHFFAGLLKRVHFSLHYSVPQGVDRGGAVNIARTQIAKRDGKPAKHSLDESAQVVDLKAERAWRNW